MKPAIFVTLPLLLAAPVAAQCTGGDGFDSAPCCNPITPNLPNFPGVVNLQSQGICWTACSTTPTTTCLIQDLSPPFPTGGPCGEFFTQYTASDCSFTPLLSGLLNLTYMRTWQENASGSTIQVWRFGAKIDMFEVSLAPPGCPNPPCATLTTSAFYYGYVDYALDCVSGVWETAIVLFHNCDAFIHDPALSSTPGPFHPTETFAIVGPDTAANPFVAGPGPAPASTPVLGDALRLMQGTPTTCLAEEAITAGNWLNLISGCTCPFSFFVPQNSAIAFTVAGACFGSVGTLNFFPNTPWFHWVTTSIGSWTTPGAYPGPEVAWVGEGVVRQDHPCVPVTTQTVDVMYGSITDGGYPVIGPPSQTFVDMAANYSQAVPGPYLPPYVGNVLPSSSVVYFNL